ncbi:hypothetical protein AS9A_3288 [Hoyosella subflava DQS3-9A1]|uniref:Uncharacterized protein n=1 Tax=Hoyosella subflava (strain DSM 45089 / JCM 17490 / NBRC 109087 / DQS3-9A1) TaxID=443218 RepID=F6EP70_HOYSD|nr:hypothetical protein AS9A_3288 [Hoyosella subflava DQS3-9A1]
MEQAVLAYSPWRWRSWIRQQAMSPNILADAVQRRAKT